MQQLTLPEELSRRYTGWAVRLADVLRQSRSVTVITHRNADPDAIGAAAVTLEIAARYVKDTCLALPEGLSKPSKQLVEYAGWSPPLCDKPSPGTLIIVDSSNTTQLGSYAGLLETGRIVLVDHHQPGTLVEMADLAIVDPGAASASEITLLLAYVLGVPVTGRAATVALGGIIYDSRRYATMTLTTMLASTIALSRGAKPPEPLLKSHHQGPAEFSERYARVKAASRARVGRACKEIIVVVTHVGSFESSAARGLLDLGADVAVVVSDRGREFRASVRVSKRAQAKGIKANTIAEYLAAKYGGQGGGHPAAALAHLEPFAPTVEEAVDDIARRLPGKVSRLCTMNGGGGDG